MQADLTESVQASIRPGDMVDTYYYGETNIEKQAYPCIVNNRFVQAFTNTGAGSSQFVISPQQGVSDICLQFVMPTIATTTGLTLSAGWGYALINRISVRYGSSAQYFWSGPQMLLQNMLDSENSTKCADLMTIGGLYASGAACSGAQANVYLKLPHNSCRAEGKPLPFPSDLLVQPIVVTIELYAASAIFILATGGGSLSTAPAALASAQLQVKQEMLTDTSDLLARRVDMNSNAYTFPLQYFCQQETQIPLIAQAGSQSVNLTGFRAGEVRNILLWLTLNTDTNPGDGSFNPQRWAVPSSTTLTYNGEVFARYDGSSGLLWNLVCDSKSQVFSWAAALSTSAPNASVTTASGWLDFPFAQVNLPYDKETKLLHGKPILNAVVNLQLTTPTASAYTLHAMYLYNASLLCSRGSAEYIF
jgi:hypothetical protein